MESFRSMYLHTLAILAIVLLLLMALAGCQTGDNSGSTNKSRPKKDEIVIKDKNGANYNPIIKPANFVNRVDNPLFALKPGKVWTYEGKNEDGETERIQVEVTAKTKTILGVAAIVVRDRVWLNDELVEDTFDWYAQDKLGNVWYFGEDSREIKDGKVISTAGSWEAGVNGAKPGIIMKAKPQVGEAYRQEFYKGEAEDMAEILSTDRTVEIEMGSYEDCLQTKEWTPLEPEVVEHKFYCKEAGNVILEQGIKGGGGKIELIKIKD